MDKYDKAILDLNDLWIGDEVLLKKSGRIGKFHGIQKGKAKVKVGNRIILSSKKNLERYEGTVEVWSDDTEPINNTTLKTSVPDSLDLHIEKLNPAMTHALPERIRDLQLKALNDYLQRVIEQKLRKITIIHGKGTGVLKTETLHTLNFFDEVHIHFPVNQGGATEVWLKYD